MEFNSLEELYKRVLPALHIKVKECSNTVTEKEIWDYLTTSKWIMTKDLSLAEIVSDILNCDVSLIKNNN